MAEKGLSKEESKAIIDSMTDANLEMLKSGRRNRDREKKEKENKDFRDYVNDK